MPTLTCNRNNKQNIQTQDKEIISSICCFTNHIVFWYDSNLNINIDVTLFSNVAFISNLMCDPPCYSAHTQLIQTGLFIFVIYMKIYCVN